MPAGAKPWLKGRKKRQLHAANFVKAPPTAERPASSPAQPSNGSGKRSGGKKSKAEQQLTQPPSKRRQRDGAAIAAAPSSGTAGPGRAAAASNGGDSSDSAHEDDSDVGHEGSGELIGEASSPAALAGLERVPVAQLRKASGADDREESEGVRWRNKEKVLMLTSRGIPPRHRHLLLDLMQLLPGAKRDSKLDTKSDRAVINEAAELKGCSSALFFEARKRKDCYLWAAKVPSGPTAKFLIVNVHTMAELKLSGNHLKGSRPVLSFDQTFDSEPHWILLKEVLSQMFSTPKRHHKSKPFFDHVISFCVADGRIWLRNYQVCPAVDKAQPAATAAVGGGGANLVEVGPRACLNPILIFSGAFGGPVIWENPGYVSPNDLRAAAKRQEAGKYSNKVAKRAARRVHKAENAIPKGELDDLFK